MDFPHNPAADAPAISVMVCTRDRPLLLPRALASVVAAAARTPEAGIEIVVVDDGNVPLAAGATGDARIRRVVGPRQGVGAARAAGLAAARGAVIAYCDDDDEWLPDHLRVLLDALRAHPAAALVWGEPLWREMETIPDERAPSGAAERMPELGVASRMHASDVLHRAAAARDVGGFDPSLLAYEDIDLWRRMEDAHVFQHVPIPVTLHARHPGRVTAAEQPGARARLLGFHRAARPWREHEPDRPAWPPFDPGTWQPPRRELLWRSPLNPGQSFGLVGRQLLFAAVRAGIAVSLAAPPPPGDRALRGFPVAGDGGGRIGFSYDYWSRAEPLPTERLVIATACEGTLVVRPRVNAINQTASLLLVPCEQNRQAFRAGGVRVPIVVRPYGVDPVRFPRLERLRAAGDPFTFGTIGVLSPRKGIDVLVRAFCAEFRPSEPVRLVLKSVDDLPFALAADPRIRVLRGFWSHEQLLTLLRGLDAFVLPSRAEGFGLCGLEAMATGLPTIATNWSGPADYLDPADSLLLRYRLVDAAATEANGVRYFGEWAEPDEDHLRELLRWLYEHRETAAAMGSAAAARVHREWTWDRMAARFRDDLDLLATGLSPV